MQKIIPHLWFDKEALEAAELYVSLFDNSKIISITKLSGTPSGDTEIVNFQLADVAFSAMSAGPFFHLNPSVSLSIACGNREDIDLLYSKLAPGGKELMPLGQYPFSEYYGWIEDRFGLSWQLMLVDDGDKKPAITPVLLFADDVCGQAEDAIDYYASVFGNAEKGFVSKYSEGEAVDQRAKVNYGEVVLDGCKFVVMDHGAGGDFTFNEAFSFMVLCKDQKEIDYYWDKLSFVPEAEECGWAKDQFGVSWQIVPENMNAVLAEASEVERARITEAFLKMKKLDMEEIERARLG